jgi:ubiquinone/menaquinone biosynthesis C-methylase UbiE
MMEQVGKFFDAQADAYHAKTAGMAPFHVVTAARLEEGLSGKVVAIGGIWAQADMRACRDLDLTVVDVSPRMLEHWTAAGFQTIQGDARQTPFDDESIDHVVLPLILHHVTEGSWSESRRQVTRVLDEARRILKRGGRVWISDYSVGPAIYMAQRLASVLTKRILELAGIPLVIMHPQRFYERKLLELGFSDVSTFRPRPLSTSSFDVVTPIIGLDWLRVPRGIYPVKPMLISATKQ